MCNEHTEAYGAILLDIRVGTFLEEEEKEEEEDEEEEEEEKEEEAYMTAITDFRSHRLRTF